VLPPEVFFGNFRRQVAKLCIFVHPKLLNSLRLRNFFFKYDWANLDEARASVPQWLRRHGELAGRFTAIRLFEMRSDKMRADDSDAA